MAHNPLFLAIAPSKLESAQVHTCVSTKIILIPRSAEIIFGVMLPVFDLIFMQLHPASPSFPLRIPTLHNFFPSAELQTSLKTSDVCLAWELMTEEGLKKKMHSFLWAVFSALNLYSTFLVVWRSSWFPLADEKWKGAAAHRELYSEVLMIKDRKAAQRIVNRTPTTAGAVASLEWLMNPSEV